MPGGMKHPYYRMRQTCLSLSVSRVSSSDLKDHFDMVYRMLADHAMDMLAVLL